MADIGFSIEQKDVCLKSGEYLELFEIEKEEYDITEKQVRVNVIENRPEELKIIKDYGKYVLCNKDNKKIIFAPYGHYYPAVTFCHRDWYEDECGLCIAPGIAQEGKFTINKLFSIAGIHSAFLKRGGLVLHASYVVTAQGAILFTAPSQIGKSTQARLWKEFAGAEIINGDRVIIRKKKDKWYAYGYSVCGSSDICKNREVPIQVIVVLEQGKKNEIKSMSKIEKYRALLLASAIYSWDMEQINMADKIISKIIDETVIVRLACLPDENAVHTLKNYLGEEV